MVQHFGPLSVNSHRVTPGGPGGRRGFPGFRPVPEILAGLYQSFLEAPEAFEAEYEATTGRVLSILQSPGAQKKRRQVGGTSALHYSAGCGSLELVEALLKKHPKLNFQEDQHGHTPLLWAVRHGMAKAMQLLLRHGALAWHCDAKGLTALHWAAALGYTRICKLLLAVPFYAAALKDQRCKRGWTPLHSAAYGGSASCCSELLDSGANVALRTPKEEWTALHLAAVKGHTEVLQVLAKRCSTEVVLALDHQGFSAQDLAEAAGQRKAAEALRAEEPDRHLVRCCSKSGPRTPEADLDLSSLRIQAPVLEKVGLDAVELCCQVVDLESRLAGYVVELRNCSGATGAAFARVYYARAAEQQKVDAVEFLVPRLRSSGQAIWRQ
ncbi:unnamed protein product, partial [Effrenium voratum]